MSGSVRTQNVREHHRVEVVGLLAGDGMPISYVESSRRGGHAPLDFAAYWGGTLDAESIEKKWPVLGRHEQAEGWLLVWVDLGRAPRTIDAYARGLAEYLQVCERDGVDPITANRANVAAYVRELSTRPGRRGANVVSIDSGSGLANATLQQRLVPVRRFYDFLIEEGVRESNPVGRGKYHRVDISAVHSVVWCPG
ncbi:site-specific integrase [Streptomyces sp. NPDC060064]|uniref:site-specific integrase n=1 Tax=Streptomyces sp. NPDC060064 TaxID=3347049 RepID=UPI003699FB1E